MDYRLKTFRILGQQLPPCCISHYDPLGWEGSSFLAFLTSFYLHLKELSGCIEAHLHVEMTLLEKARRYDTSLQLLHQSHSLAKPYSWLTQNNPPSCGYHYRHSVHMTLNQVSAMASRKCWKYRKFYQLQHVAFAPIFANSVGQCKPNLLQVLWNLYLADHYAQTMLILSGSNMPLSSAPTTRKSSSTLGPTIHKNGQRILKCVFRHSQCTYGITFKFQLDLFPAVHQNSLSSCDTTGHGPGIQAFEMDMVLFVEMDMVSSCIRSKRHNSTFPCPVPSLTTHATSKQSSLLEQPFYSSNPSLMDKNNLLSLHRNAVSFLTFTRRLKKVSRINVFSASPPLLFHSTLHQHPHKHTFAFWSTLTMAASLTTLFTFVHYWILYPSK